LFQEVTLNRTGSDQKVGLTLCYGSACDEVTDIYIGEVRGQSRCSGVTKSFRASLND